MNGRRPTPRARRFAILWNSPRDGIILAGVYDSERQTDCLLMPEWLLLGRFNYMA